MAEADDEPGFVGLAEFLGGLVSETVAAVHSAQIAQSEDESELRAVASLDVEAAAEKLVAAEAAQMLVDELMTESGAGADWAGRQMDFVRLAKARLGIVLVAESDYGKRGLTDSGAMKTLAAARRTIGSEQLQLVERLLSEGTRRVKVASGAYSIKVEMRTDPPRPASVARAGKTAEPRRSQEKLNRTLPGLRITVRPAQRRDGEAAAVFGGITINFVVV